MEDGCWYRACMFLPEFIAEIVHDELEPAEDEQLSTLLFGGVGLGM